MNAQQLPPHNAPAPDGQDDNADKRSSLWSRVQAFFILVALALVIAELVLSVEGRGLSHKALGIAKQAKGTATDKVSLSCMITALADTRQFNQVKNNVTRLQTELEVDVTRLENGLTNLTELVNDLQKKIKTLASASPTSSISSAAPSASEHSYYAGSSRVRNSPNEALGWILVEGVLALLV
jgi:uncharacterized protein YlxW (UPF0749 family)